MVVAPEFAFLAILKATASPLKGGGCRRGTNFVSQRQRRVTDGNFFSLKSCFLAIKSPKT
jgi:hypothetical protein